MTPDQYRREGAEAMRAYIANHCDPAHLPRSENPTEFYAGYRHAAIEKFTAIRAIDVDEVLAGMPPVPDATARLVEATMTDQLDPPKDGTMVCLLVDYSGNGGAPLEDALTAWTIGYNTLADTGEDEWIMVGWDWCHDCYCQGSGKIIGWAPFAPTMTTPDTAAIRGRYCELPNVGVVVDAAAVDRDIAALCDELERMRAEAERLRTALKSGVDLIKGEAVGLDWKRGCTAFLVAARAALALKKE